LDLKLLELLFYLLFVQITLFWLENSILQEKQEAPIPFIQTHILLFSSHFALFFK